MLLQIIKVMQKIGFDYIIVMSPKHGLRRDNAFVHNNNLKFSIGYYTIWGIVIKNIRTPHFVFRAILSR